MDYLIYGLLIPLAPYCPAHASSDQELGLLYGAYDLFVTPVFGYLGDRIGRLCYAVIRKI